MNNVQKKKELQILKKSQTQSLWFWVLVLCISVVTLLFFAYLGAIFKNQYVDKYLFGNDLILAILIGIIIGLFLLLFAFIFLNIFKRLHIRDYFQYYAYVNSLRNNSCKNYFDTFQGIEINLQNFYCEMSNKLTHLKV